MPFKQTKKQLFFCQHSNHAYLEPALIHSKRHQLQSVRQALSALLLLVLYLFGIFLLTWLTTSQAQSLPNLDQQVEQVLNRQIEEEQRRERQRTNRQAPLSQREKAMQLQEIPNTEVDQDGPCFVIRETILQEETGFLPTPPVYNSLNDSCVNKTALIHLLNEMNRYYQDNGYVTTRVYFPAQNIQQGTLLLIVKAGSLEDMKFLDSELPEIIPNSRLKNAYPIDIGETITLRALEQGMDNFNRPQSQSGKAQLYPGTETGQSILVMKTQQSKPWRLKTLFNNHGYESTGINKGGIHYSHENLLNINETLSLSYNRNAKSDNGSKLSQSASVSYTQPYKNWLFSAGNSHYRYERLLPGINQNYRIDGFSRSVNFNVERLLHRDKQMRLYFTAGLAKKRSENYIEDLQITSQSRELALASLGLRGDKSLPDQTLVEWLFTISQKIAALGSQKVIPGIADDEFTYFQGTLKLQKPFGDKNKYRYAGELVGQFSQQELTGSEQFSAGGMSSVRGFHQESIYGNKGFYLRNQIGLNQPPTEGDWVVAPSLALDAGYVASPETIDWSQNDIAGMALLVQITYQKFCD